MNIISAMSDENLFQPWFKGASWDGWRIVLKAAYGLAMTEAERVQFRQLAAREPPVERVRELWACTGRRSGKDSVASLIVAFEAAFFENADGLLRPGERAQCMCLAVDRDQAKIVLGYVRSYFADIALLRKLVQRETANGLELVNGVDVVVATTDYRAVRGRPVLCAVLDEVAFWSDATMASPDTETYTALVPGTATIPNAMIIGISTPYRRGGLLFEKHSDHYGREGDVLVIAGPSVALNPTLPRELIARELARDPIAARAEWLGEFRHAVDAYVDRALIDIAVDRGVVSRPPMPFTRYKAFVDPSGGQSDSACLAISHQDETTGAVVLDVLFEAKAPHNPAEITARMAAIIRAYDLDECRGDRYSANWVVEAFRSCGVRYIHSEWNRSEIYLNALPLFSGGKARLLDNPVLIEQFSSLERRPGGQGRDRVDHRRGDAHHDDASNAAAGALTLAATTRFDPARAMFANYDNMVPMHPIGPTRLERAAALWSVPSTIPIDEPDPPGITRSFRLGKEMRPAAPAPAPVAARPSLFKVDPAPRRSTTSRFWK